MCRHCYVWEALDHQLVVPMFQQPLCTGSCTHAHLKAPNMYLLCVCVCVRQAGTDAEEQLLSLSVCLATGVSWWFANCQTNRPRVFSPLPLLLCARCSPRCPRKFIIPESARSRGGHGGGARAAGGGRHERYMAARLLSAALCVHTRVCVCLCAIHRKREGHLSVDVY